MNNLIKKIHIYAGLLTFTYLFVIGITGLAPTFRTAPQNRPQRVFQEDSRPFSVPQGLTDREVAQRVYEFLDPPLTTPPAEGAIRRDGDNNLVFQVHNVNGNQRVTVLEEESRVKIETSRNSIWQYFEVLHETSVRSQVQDLSVRLWTYYNEFSIWSLMLMSFSGLYLWLSSRPRYRLAQGSFVIGCGLFLALYFLGR